MSRSTTGITAILLATTLTPPASAADYAVVSHCAWSLTNRPGSMTEVALVLVAQAHASGPTPAATTSVVCTVENRFHETLVASGSMVGDHVVAASSRLMRFAPPSYCVSSSAVWVDATTTVTHTEYEEEHCHDA